MLWIAVHLPLLSLEAWSQTLPLPQQQGPLALTDAHVVVAANAMARAHGVEPGMRRVTAKALSPALVLGRADPLRDAVALQAAAHAALAYTPSVTVAAASLATPGAPALLAAAATSAAPTAAAAGHTVLLEVAASLRCFGGQRSLLERLAGSLAPLGHLLRCAGAPTPQAAMLLARSSTGAALDADLPCVPASGLVAAVDRLPAWLLAAGSLHWPAWQDIGVRTIGDLRCLPRSALAQRYGESVHSEIDRALGRCPDPRVWLVLAPTFADRVELQARAESAEPLLQAATVLLTRLLAWATAHHALIGRCELRLHHERHRHHDGGPDTCVELALAEPSCDRAHLLLLLRERLARLQLPAATLELSLHCHALVHSAPPNGELFATRTSERLGLLQLIERLQARLGHGEVQRLVPVPDHRPERDSTMPTLQSLLSSRHPPQHQPHNGKGRSGRHETDHQRVQPLPVGVAPAKESPTGSVKTATPAQAALSVQPLRPTPWPAAGRPVWLLQQPQPLAERRSRPVLDGRPLQLLCGPERIESGWWDGLLAERDYFIARSVDGALVWIYRTRLPMATGAGWYLHGRYA